MSKPYALAVMLQSWRSWFRHIVFSSGSVAERPSRQKTLDPTVRRWQPKLPVRLSNSLLLPAGILVLVLIPKLALNRNAVYLTLLGFLYTSLFCLWVSTRARLILLTFLTFLAGFTPPFTPLKMTPIDRYHTLQETELRRYTFQCFDLQEKVKQFGNLDARLVIFGQNLKDVELIDNADSGSGKIEKFAANGILTNIDLLITPVALHDRESLTVSVKLKPGGHATLMQGPECHRNVFYPDAVVLIVENKQCRLVYHALPEVIMVPGHG